jgi:anti-anti-sigma factor
MSELANLFMWRREDVVVAGVTGEIDVSNADALEVAILREVDNQAAGLVIDLAGLSFMDSSGVHLMFHFAAALRERRQHFAIVLPPDAPPRRVLELSGPELRRAIHDTEDAAIEAVVRASQ